MRVSQLAKELEKESKDIINILEKNGIEGKKAQSGLEPGEEAVIRKAYAETPVKKKKIIFVSNPQNSKISGNQPRQNGGGQDRKQPYKPRQDRPINPAPTAQSVKDAFAAVLGESKHTIKKKEEAPVEVKTETAGIQTQSEVKQEVRQEPKEEVRRIEREPAREQQNQNTRPAYQQNQNSRPNSDRPGNSYQGSGNRMNADGQGNTYARSNQTQGGPNRDYRNGQNQGGDRPAGSRPYQNNGQGASRPYQNNGQGGQGASRPYQNNGQGGQGASRPYQNNGQGGNRPYQSNGQGASRPYQSNGQGGQGASRPYQSNGQGAGRPYQGNGQGAGRPYQNNGQGGARPYQNGTQGGRPYQNNGQGGNRPYQNNGRPQGGNAGENNRFGKPAGKSSFDGESTIIQPEKRRDETKRKLGQEKDSRSKKDKIYEEDVNGIKKAGRFIKPEKKVETVEEAIKVIIIPEVLTLKDLADKMKIQPSAIVKKLFLQGKIVTVNQEISFETAEEIAIEYEIMCEREVKVDVIEELLKEEEESEEEMSQRPPVICVMGHVDHGKTSLLDAIRKTNVTDREAGGITQHIGAYTVQANGQKITFLDTPGHEAFTSMRMRGANSTDIAILVVAADDGVMPQTVEAINHAKAAGIEIIVAVNKIDKPNANIDRVKQELTEYELISEDWGGSTVFAPVSAKTGEGIEQLLEMILLTSEMLELKANSTRNARGLVIEAQLDKGRGPVATILVQKGTLRVGDFIAAGSCHGKVRAMLDDKGRRVREAGPSTPVEILGLNDVPNAGEVFVAPDNDKEARQFAATFISQGRERMLEDTKAKMSLDDLFTQIQAGNLKELNLIVKADVQGSVEAVKQSLLKLSNDEVVVKIIHGGVGAINESDVILASASQAIIIGFNVRPDVTAKATAEREGVDVRLYKVIYQAIEDVEAAMKGMLDPVFEEKVIGHAEVRQIFRASAIGNIAGSFVLDGMFQRGCKVRVTREGEQIFEGGLDSLKRFKDDVKEVKAGYECGLVFEGFDQIQELDIVEAYIMVEVPR